MIPARGGCVRSATRDEDTARKRIRGGDDGGRSTSADATAGLIVTGVSGFASTLSMTSDSVSKKKTPGMTGSQ